MPLLALSPGPAQNRAGPGDMYARSTHCVAMNCEVCVTLYSVCIWAEKTSLFMSTIFRITVFQTKSRIHFEM